MIVFIEIIKPFIMRFLNPIYHYLCLGNVKKPFLILSDRNSIETIFLTIIFSFLAEVH